MTIRWRHARHTFSLIRTRLRCQSICRYANDAHQFLDTHENEIKPNGKRRKPIKMSSRNATNEMKWVGERQTYAKHSNPRIRWSNSCNFIQLHSVRCDSSFMTFVQCFVQQQAIDCKTNKYDKKYHSKCGGVATETDIQLTFKWKVFSALPGRFTAPLNCYCCPFESSVCRIYTCVQCTHTHALEKYYRVIIVFIIALQVCTTCIIQHSKHCAIDCDAMTRVRFLSLCIVLLFIIIIIITIMCMSDRLRTSLPLHST